MTSHERVERVMRHEPPDRVPFDIPSVSDEFRASWSHHTDLPPEALEDHCALDCFEVTADHSPWPGLARTVTQTSTETISVDGFGRTLRTKSRAWYPQVLQVPLKNKTDLDHFEFESPLDPARYPAMEKAHADMKDRFWVYAKVGGPYSRSKNLRGEQQFLIDLVTDEPFARDLVARITDHMIAVGVESVRRLGLETAVHIHDDFASLQALLFSPDIYNRIFLPAMARMCNAFHNAGVRVIYGGEGRTIDVLPPLVDAGVDALLCLEPRAGMDMVELARKLDDKIVFFGNMCNTVILPKGSTQEIRAMVLRQMRFARNGRCIVGPSHSVSAEVPPENFEFLWRLVHQWAPVDAPLPRS